jgi:hypothetical protein
MEQNKRTSKQGAREVSEVLGSQSKGLGDLIKRAKYLQYLDQKLSGLLDQEMCPFVQVAAVHENCLVLVTSSAALATRLKLDSDSLLKSLHAVGVNGLSQVKIRIAPISRESRQIRRTRKLPDIAKQSLERFTQDSAAEKKQ